MRSSATERASPSSAATSRGGIASRRAAAGGGRVSCSGLGGRVARAANALRALGVQPGDRVMLLMRDSPQFAVTWLGALHAGAGAIGLNTRLSDRASGQHPPP